MVRNTSIQPVPHGRGQHTLDTRHSKGYVKSLAGDFKLHNPIKGNTRNKTIINLSDSLILIRDQLSLLEKGPSFIPYTDLIDQDRLEVQTQLTQYHGTLKLLTYFEDDQRATKTPFLPTFKWEPKLKDLPIEVGEIIDKDKEILKNWGKNHSRDPPNLTDGEKRALKTLMSETKTRRQGKLCPYE